MADPDGERRERIRLAHEVGIRLGEAQAALRAFLVQQGASPAPAEHTLSRIWPDDCTLIPMDTVPLQTGGFVLGPR